MVKNGRYWTDSRDSVQRWLCRDCGTSWKEFQEPLLDDMSALRIRTPLRTLLRRIALVAVGLPLRTVEHLECVKAETLRAQLLHLRSDATIWPAVCRMLTSDYGIPAARVREFSTDLGLIASGTRSFHALARAFRRSVRCPANRQALSEAATRILGYPVEIFTTGEVRRVARRASASST